MKIKTLFTGMFKTKAVAPPICKSYLSNNRLLSEVDRLILDYNVNGRNTYSMDPYARLLIPHRCIFLNSGKVAEIMHHSRLISSVGKKKVIEKHPVIDLLFGQPNELENSHELFVFMASELQMRGNSYVRVAGTKRMPLALEPVFSDAVTIIEGDPLKKEPRVLAYEINDNDNMWSQSMSTGLNKPIPADKIIHIKDFSDKTRLYGLSRYSPLMPEMELASMINQWQERHFKSGIFPDIIISLPPEMGPVTTEQITLAEEHMAKRIKGPGGSNVLIVSGGMTTETVSNSPADMRIQEAELQTAAMVATGFGVPAEMLGAIAKHKNMSNYKIAKRSWVEDTIVPMVRQLLNGFNGYFFNDNTMKLELNTDAIPELQPSAEEIAKMDHLSINEKRTLQGHPRKDHPLADEILVNGSLVLLDDLMVKEDEDNL